MEHKGNSRGSATNVRDFNGVPSAPKMSMARPSVENFMKTAANAKTGDKVPRWGNGGSSQFLPRLDMGELRLHAMVSLKIFVSLY